ncbi:MAG: DUF1028 domain-containing protein [Bacteroidetes bacterium]|nr:DUF1028 domain-containing protein [Bacteroidota bacterium]
MRMIIRILYVLISTIQISIGWAQDTFSIVAIDSTTGEIGSAGASCVGFTGTYPHGAQIISDVIPGIGAIHTQAAWLAANQQNAHARMMAGDTPQQIIDWLVANDVQANPLTRQYGIVGYSNGHLHAASYTGSNCNNFKNDTSNLFYSIQGNILLGQQVIDSIQARFLNTPGPLTDRLMAALQGAKMIGADTRCASPYQASSMSSFIRVAKPTDTPGNFYLDLWMSYPQSWSSGAFPVDPIDSLQTLYNNWVIWMSSGEIKPLPGFIVSVIQENGANPVFVLTGSGINKGLSLSVFDVYGRRVAIQSVNSPRTKLDPSIRLTKGMYFFTIQGLHNTPPAKGRFLQY